MVRRYSIFSYLYIIIIAFSYETVCSFPEGELAYKITLPEGFDITKDHCPTVVIQPLFQFLLRQKSCHSI